MSKVLQTARTRRVPSVASVGGASTISATLNPLIQQAEPVVIELSDEQVGELGEDIGEYFGDLPSDPEQPVTLTVPKAQVQQGPSEEPHSKMSRFKRFCRRLYRKFGMKHMITLIVMIIYTAIGAAAFLSIEKNTDIVRLQGDYEAYETDRKEFVRNFSASVVAKWDGSNITQLQMLTDEMLQEYEEKRGCKPSTETIWNFWHAMYFAGTIYTTIGYGDMYCRTRTGRVVTMVYSLIGIPLMLMTLTDLGGLLLKVMFSITRFRDACKARFSPAVLFGPHPPGYDQKPSPRYKSVLSDLATSTGNDSGTEKAKVDGDDDDVDLYELERQEDEDYEYQLMRVPVMIALTTTIGWIFLCAALFCIWEDWDYFTSVYFFFISLSTVGLGDETPSRKDIMVATYFFVIVGLSLVSMCITVIQRRLEDLYLQLLQMILQEYHRKMMASGDQTGATVQMMQAWQKSKTARFLMPLLSKDKKKTVAKKFQDEAKAQGIVLPAVLRDLNPKTGLPSVLHAANTGDTEKASQLQDFAEDAIQRAAARSRALNEPADEDFGFQAVFVAHPEIKEHPGKVVTVIPAAPPPPPIAYDADTQTEIVEMEDKQGQTTAIPLIDAQTQSQESSFAINPRVDGASQTPIIDTDDVSTQCKIEEAQPPPPPKPAGTEDETQTEVITQIESSAQTTKVVNKEQEIQTHLYDLNVMETQTDLVQTKNIRLQTPIPEILEQGAQTDPLILDPEQFQATGSLSMKPPASDRRPSGSWAKAKKNIKNAISLGKTPKVKKELAVPAVPEPSGRETTPAMATWNDVVGEHDGEGAEEEPEAPEDELGRRGSEESLAWDPIDGLHSEPKMNVKDLKKMFEKPASIKRTESGRRSFKKH